MLSEATIVRGLNDNPNSTLVSLIIAGMAAFWILLRFRGSLEASARLSGARHRRLMIVLSPAAGSLLYWASVSLDFPFNLIAFIAFTLFIGGLVSSFMQTIFRDVSDDQWRTSVSQFKAYTVIFQTLFLILFKATSAPEPYTILLASMPVALIAASMVSGMPISWVTLRALDNIIDAASGIVVTVPRRSELLMISTSIGGLVLAKLTLIKTSTESVTELLASYGLGYVAGSILASLYPSIYLAQVLAGLSLVFSSAIGAGTLLDMALLALGAALGYSEIATILKVLEAKPRGVRRTMTLITVWVALATFMGGLAVYILGKPVPEVGLALVGLGASVRIVSASREGGFRWS